MNLSSDVLVEPLTRREGAILLHLVERKSNQEIAALESLALTSVKWYVQQIYAKLGVNRRSAVVERAQELGLLPVIPGPPLSTSSGKHNLTAQLTKFIGREREIVELRSWIKKRDNRLVTLTGSGGIGKTRLALHVAEGLLDAFPDGVWLVELAPLADPYLVPQTIITALGLVEQPGKTSVDFLTDYLRQKHALLILDNCEHLIEACAELVARLLQNAPRLTILVTSREILGVSGEVSYRVLPLGMPDQRRLPPPERLARYDAVRLFVDRARFVNPEFTITEENASTIAQITRQLDGIPLALELAAARLRILSVGQIALRLNDAFRLLTGGSRTALPRLQTLQASIDWSYALLTADERALLRGLSVFAGEWTLAASEEVCGQDQDILDLLGQLADKSLILTVTTPNGELRYRMLETVRQYAYARLVENGEEAAVRKRHLDYYLRLGERLEPRLHSREQIQALNELGGELDNLRLALEWALQADIEAGLRLASALQWFWEIRYHIMEGITWLEQGLEAEALSRGVQTITGSRALIRAKSLMVYGFLLSTRNDQGLWKAKLILEEALSLYRASGLEHSRGKAWALLWLGISHKNTGNSIQGKVLVEESLGLFRECGDGHGMSDCLDILGDCETDTARQKNLFLEMFAINQANGDIDGIAKALFCLGACANLDGDYVGAYAEFSASRENYRQVDNPWQVALMGVVLALIAQCNGDLEGATREVEESLRGYRELADERQVAFCLFWKGLVAFARGWYPQVRELLEETGGILQKTGESETFAESTYLRVRLARLIGDIDAACRLAEEGLNTGLDLGPSRMWLLLERGSLALQEGELNRAHELLREGLQILLPWNMTHWVIFPLDALAVLALREGRLERAARLFGTRQWHGAANFLSPIERGEREVGLSDLKARLGEGRFEQLQEEGKALNFNQVLALALEAE